jgi:hypothetical protein
MKSNPEPKFDPQRIQTLSLGENPLRFAISGITNFLPQLADAVTHAEPMCESLKGFIIKELGDIETNAAKLDLHLVDHPHGGVSLHLHISPVQLGGNISKPVRPAALPPELNPALAPVDTSAV